MADIRKFLQFPVVWKSYQDRKDKRIKEDCSVNKLGYLGSFVVGGGIGALVAWVFTKKKYEKLADEEIRSAREEFAKDTHIVIVKNEEEAKKINSKDEVEEYKKVIKENHYTSYKQALDGVKQSVKEQEVILPYPIEPDEHGESGFAKETLIWYEGDSTLADESGKIIDGPDEVVGLNNLDDFKTSDVIYIRNETEEVDYEIIRDPSTYNEAYNPNYIPPEYDE